MTRLLIALALGLAGAAAAAPQKPAEAPAGTRPEIYFYPAPYRLADGSLLSSPLTVSADQITTLFPAIDEMDGVALSVPWSLLCPTKDCDFSLIDQALAYWGGKGKKVLLAVITVGYPFKVVKGHDAHFQNETPDWVLDKVKTYTAHTRALGHVGKSTETDAAFPSYDDPRFVDLVSDLVSQLGRKYDGNPAISTVRMSMGLMGEENPTVYGLRAPRMVPGFTTLGWIRFCEAITAAYERAFKKSPLEFGFSYLPAARARMTAAERAAESHFLEHLRERGIVLEYGGLRSVDLAEMDKPEDAPSGQRQALLSLKNAKQRGEHIGLEGAPLTSDKMDDVGAVTEVVKRVQPDQLVLWGIDAGALNYQREGPNPANETSVQFLSKQKHSLAEYGKRNADFLRQVTGAAPAAAPARH